MNCSWHTVTTYFHFRVVFKDEMFQGHTTYKLLILLRLRIIQLLNFWPHGVKDEMFQAHNIVTNLFLHFSAWNDCKHVMTASGTMVLKLFCDWFTAPFSKGTFYEMACEVGERITTVLEKRTDCDIENDNVFGATQELWSKRHATGHSDEDDDEEDHYDGDDRLPNNQHNGAQNHGAAYPT